METLVNFLKSVGVEQSAIDAMTAETTPDDFNFDDAVSAFIQKRRDLTLNDSKVQEEMKKKYNSEQYPAIIKPILKKMKDSFGLTTEEVNALVEDGKAFPDVKKLIDTGIGKMKTTSAQGVDEVKQQLFDLRAEYDQFKTTSTTERENLLAGFERERKQEKVKMAFHKAVSGLDLTLPKDTANKVLSTILMEKYNFDVTDDGLSALTKDGNKPANDKGFLTAIDLIKQEAETMQIMKKSNGGQQQTTTTQKTSTGREENPEESDRVKAMRKRIEERNNR
jgi:hypothetical protein